MVELELTSGFSFQPGRWLADMKPDWLTSEQRQRLQAIKAAKATRKPQAKSPRPQQLPLF